MHSNIIIFVLAIIFNTNIISQSEIYITVDQEPIFTECEINETKKAQVQCSQNALLRLVYQTIEYPIVAELNNHQGRVVVEFIIDSTGAMVSPKIASGIGGGCDDEALRVFKQIEQSEIRWNPALKDGKAVNFKKFLPINYSLEEQAGPMKIIIKNLDKEYMTLEINEKTSFRLNGEFMKIRKLKNRNLDKIFLEPIQSSLDPDYFELISYEEAIKKGIKSDPGTYMMARFPGCEHEEMNVEERESCSKHKMLQALYRNLNYPASARKKGISGTAYMEFEVDEFGKLSEQVIIQDESGYFEEAVRSVYNYLRTEYGTWVPAKQNGENVKCKYTMPVKFKIE